MIWKILIGIVILLIVIQFIQPEKNSGSASSATDITHVVTVPDTVMSLLKVACYDCHSDHTRYPWYNNITPVNWWLWDHVSEGKKELNFSQYATYNAKRKSKKMDGIAKETKEHEMPISSYLWIHKDARLSDAQRQVIVDWANAAKQQLGTTPQKQ
ncbi:MAG: heme-binding domain-containing protein [Candidatus Dadabacteria bacterium]